jgi:8-hydroxy-5-deazaflavin:NADPH oxidoreductase
MKIAIIGTGNIGSTLGTKWVAAGHTIFAGVRDTGSFKGEALAADKNVLVQSIKEAAGNAEVILIATPAHVVPDIIPELGDVNSKVIIDATNAVRMKPEGYHTAYDAFAALTKAELVKCFNTTGFENMANPLYGNEAIDMFMAGSSSKAKTVAKQLALETGFADCIDFGGADKVALLEQFALCWINLAMMQGMGRNIAFTLRRR